MGVLSQPSLLGHLSASLSCPGLPSPYWNWLVGLQEHLLGFIHAAHLAKPVADSDDM